MRITKIIFIFFFISQTEVFAQLKIDSLQKPGVDSIQKPGIDSVQKIISDSLQKLTVDTSKIDSDSAIVRPPIKTYQAVLDKLLSANKYINLKQDPVSFTTQKKQTIGKEYLFYLLSCILLIFGLFKVFYARYFHNIFRVFFNTSLRQNQLTDLLLQARLPSLIFNIFFTVTAGVYVWLLLNNYYVIGEYNPRILFFCIGAVAVIYATKFCVLKFIGWLTGMSTILNTYIFVIFLINKIIGVTLIPFIIFLAFAPIVLVKSGVIISLLLLSVFFLMRFFRSYSLLQHQLNLSRIHFLLYIISLELLPLLIIYKLSLSFFLKYKV